MIDNIDTKEVEELLELGFSNEVIAYLFSVPEIEIQHIAVSRHRPLGKVAKGLNSGVDRTRYVVRSK